MGEGVEEERQQKAEVLSQTAEALPPTLSLPWGEERGSPQTCFLWVPRENNLGLAALQPPGANTCHLKSDPTRW